MDADMQDPPSLLPEMLEILHTQDYDSVATRRKNREGEPPIRSWFAHRFYEIINKISDADIVDGARDFRLMKREMVEAIVSMTEYNRFSKGIFGWIGFKTYWLSYDNIERVAGETKWNFWKLTKYAIDGIINFSQAPLSAVSGFGVLMTVVSFLMLVVVVGRKLIYGCRMGINDLCDHIYWWSAAVLSGRDRTLYCKDVFGDEAETAFYYFRNKR
jgi:hypothetical protein